MLVPKAKYEHMLEKLKERSSEHKVSSVNANSEIDASEFGVDDTSKVSDKENVREVGSGDKENASESYVSDKENAGESSGNDKANLYVERPLSDMTFVSQKRNKRRAMLKRNQRRPLKSVGNSKWINYLV